jgi:hypothetical protein
VPKKLGECGINHVVVALILTGLRSRVAKRRMHGDKGVARGGTPHQNASRTKERGYAKSIL